jgi:hypothetical protein
MSAASVRVESRPAGPYSIVGLMMLMFVAPFWPKNVQSIWAISSSVR